MRLKSGSGLTISNARVAIGHSRTKSEGAIRVSNKPGVLRPAPPRPGLPLIAVVNPDAATTDSRQRSPRGRASVTAASQTRPAFRPTRVAPTVLATAPLP